ncbi:MAG: penicillin acylase family protein, partial [Deltaproteobacteria bacterium]|nr:penicillin acylase family protein [Deltaproteobacteria bacterium]
EESLAVMYLMSWDSAANLTTEIIAGMLIEKLGIEKAREIFPLNINPDDPGYEQKWAVPLDKENCGVSHDKKLAAYLTSGPLQLGSNNWTVGALSSPGGKPVVANDPHLNVSMLPGPWYPIGIITPDTRFVGVGIPGVPGIVIGRTAHIALGVTNAYGDAQDLYVETIDPADPGRYLEGDVSRPFEVIEEAIKIKDKKAEAGFRSQNISIRLTRRGPVISDVLPGLKTDKVISMRWAPFETMEPAIGLDRILHARSVYDVRDALRALNVIMLNFVFADTQGNIGWQASGTLPVRSRGNGTIPYVVKNTQDNWNGWIPFDDMPQSYNPTRGWVGTCNHMTVASDYPYYYSSHMSPSFRYRRLKALLESKDIITPEDHWHIQRDTKNLLARQIAPIIAEVLASRPGTMDMARILEKWDYFDNPDLAAPAVFQVIYRNFAQLVFADELGEDLATTMLKDWYFWEERLLDMVHKGSSAWFDNVLTQDTIETRDDLFYQAALAARTQLEEYCGRNPEKWRWGKIHRLTFVSPIRRSGFGAGLLGAGSHPMGGSGQTLYRAIYSFDRPFEVTTSASLRMVADLADDDKVLAILPGGVSGRVFDPHGDDQVGPFMSGEKRYWWFSDQAIQEHSRKSLILNP